MTTPISGSCTCKKVQYSITSAISMAVNCHCNSCKKATGGAFASLAVVKEKHLLITSGKSCLTTYKRSEIVTKYFCSGCGTPIFNRNNRYPGRCMVALGSLDNQALVIPTVNVHCENRLGWVLLDERMQNFEQGYNATTATGTARAEVLFQGKNHEEK